METAHFRGHYYTYLFMQLYHKAVVVGLKKQCWQCPLTFCKCICRICLRHSVSSKNTNSCNNKAKNPRLFILQPQWKTYCIGRGTNKVHKTCILIISVIPSNEFRIEYLIFLSLMWSYYFQKYYLILSITTRLNYNI